MVGPSFGAGHDVVLQAFLPRGYLKLECAIILNGAPRNLLAFIFLAVPPIRSPYIMAAYLGWEALLLRLRSSRAGWPRASMLLVEPLPDRGLRYRL